MRAHLARVDAVVVQAVIAGALSFSHLHDLAAAAGQGGWKAWAYPVSVDLLLVASWRRMRQLQRTGQAAGSPRLWFLVALAASLGANVATAGLLDLDHVPASLRVVVAGWPAIAFFGGTLLAHTPPGQEPSGHSDSPTAGPYEEQTHAPAAIDVPVPEELPEPTPPNRKPSRLHLRPVPPSRSRPPLSSAPGPWPTNNARPPAAPPTPTPSAPGSACPRP